MMQAGLRHHSQVAPTHCALASPIDVTVAYRASRRSVAVSPTRSATSTLWVWLPHRRWSSSPCSAAGVGRLTGDQPLS